MVENYPLLKKYLAENGWDIQEIKKMAWTKHPDYNWYWLGKEKQ